MKRNIYLDIDGVLRGCASPKEDIEEFLWYCLDNYPDSIYWLTTHCNHGVNRAPEAIQNEFPKELVDALSKQVKATEWDTLKTDGIDKDQDFVWFDDNLFETERQVLEAYYVDGGFFRMNPKDPEMVKKALNHLKSLEQERRLAKKRLSSALLFVYWAENKNFKRNRPATSQIVALRLF